jgi:hypothetical protein
VVIDYLSATGPGRLEIETHELLFELHLPAEN